MDHRPNDYSKKWFSESWIDLSFLKLVIQLTSRGLKKFYGLQVYSLDHFDSFNKGCFDIYQSTQHINYNILAF